MRPDLDSPVDYYINLTAESRNVTFNIRCSINTTVSISYLSSFPPLPEPKRSPDRNARKVAPISTGSFKSTFSFFLGLPFSSGVIPRYKITPYAPAITVVNVTSIPYSIASRRGFLILPDSSPPDKRPTRLLMAIRNE